MPNTELDDEFSKVYQENYIADSSNQQIVYRDKLTGREVAEPGTLPLETGYPEGIEPGSEEAITYDIRRIRIHGFPQNYLDAQHLEEVNKMKEGSQITDPAWITASKIMYHYLEVSDITLAKNMIGNQDPETEGGQGPKSDKEYAEWGRDWMGSFLNNISYMTIDAAKMSDAPIEVAKAMYYLLETADRDGVLLRNFKNGLYYTAQDVSNYVGLTTLGLALIPKFVGKAATKKAIKQSLFKKIVSASTSKMAALVGVESGSYFALEDGIRQKVKMDADLQEEFDYLRNTGAFATGTIFGNTLTRGLEAGAPIVKKGFEKVGQALKKPDNTQLQNEIDLVPDQSLENVPQETSDNKPFPVPDNPFVGKNTKPFSLVTSKEDLIEGAKISEDARTWYTRHNETIGELFGDEAQLFKELIGITSQQASVDENIARAMMVYDYLKTHGTFAKLKAKDKNVLNPTEHHLPLLSGVIKNLRRLEGIDPSATGKLATQKGIRERMGYEPTETTFGIKTYLGGNKVPDFVEAMFEGTDEVVTMDRHMIQILFGEKAQINNSSMAEGKRIITEIANELGWTPKETQAAIWSFNQIKDSDIVKRKGVDLTDVRDYKKAIEERRDAINELISKFPDNKGQGKSSQPGSNTVAEDNRKTTGANNETGKLDNEGGS